MGLEEAVRLVASALHGTTAEWRIIREECQKQRNSWDCGVLLLHFMRTWLCTGCVQAAAAVDCEALRQHLRMMFAPLPK